MSAFNEAPVGSAPTATSEDPSTTFTGWAAFPGCKGVLQKWSYHPRPLTADDIEIEITNCGICGSEYATPLPLHKR